MPHIEWILMLFVLNEKKELLVVQENSGRMKGTGIWKIPNGGVEEGEDIFKRAVREVKEETGIDTEFLEVLVFRSGVYSFRYIMRQESEKQYKCRLILFIHR